MVLLSKGAISMTQSVFPFLMFNGDAKEALTFYSSVFKDFNLISMKENDGIVLHAIFSIKGQQIMAIDNTNGDTHHFSPAMSLFVTCANEEELETTFTKLKHNGTVMMPLAPLPYAKKIGWIADKYGVNWQLNLHLDKDQEPIF
ncbi:MAG: VOC family protein [Carnobacterium sp.]